MCPEHVVLHCSFMWAANRDVDVSRVDADLLNTCAKSCKESVSNALIIAIERVSFSTYA